MERFRRQVEEAAEFIQDHSAGQPEVALILGTGLSGVADVMQIWHALPYEKIPYHPVSTVLSHHGRLLCGEWAGKSIIAMQGRFHLYEGYTALQISFPIRVMATLGIKTLIISNAAGGLNPHFQPGDLMLITDHINLTGANPLIGPNLDTLGPRFPDMSEAYDAAMRECAAQAAAEIGLLVRQGVYIGLSGPNYETPAEIRMCRTLGADAVGMSTVGEVIVANHMGIGVLGISCITNLAAGIAPQRLTHAEVMETTGRVGEQFGALLSATIPRLPRLLADALRRGNDDQ